MAELAPGNVQQALDWAYNKAVDGIEVGGKTVVKPVQALVEEYAKKPLSIEQQIDRMIRSQHTYVTVTGFVAGLPGAIAMPVTIPADLANVFYVQLRMAAAIACLYGEDPQSDEVRAFCYACLLGNAAREVLAKAGVQIANKVARNVVMKKVSGATIRKINQQVGFRLVTKAGTRGVINLVKIVPVIGGFANAELVKFFVYGAVSYR